MSIIIGTYCKLPNHTQTQLSSSFWNTSNMEMLQKQQWYCFGLSAEHVELWFQTQEIYEIRYNSLYNSHRWHHRISLRRCPTPTRTTRTPSFWGYPPPSHDYPHHWVILDPKSKKDKVKVTNFKKLPKFHYTWHTWSCLIKCANMKWIRWVLLKIQSGHDSVHRRTRWYQYTPSLRGGGGGGGGGGDIITIIHAAKQVQASQMYRY